MRPQGDPDGLLPPEGIRYPSPRAQIMARRCGQGDRLKEETIIGYYPDQAPTENTATLGGAA